MTQEQLKAREQITIMQDEWKREQQIVQTLEKDKEKLIEDLEDERESNRELQTVYQALRSDIEVSKNKMQQLSPRKSYNS